MKYVFFFFSAILISCQSSGKKLTAQQIIDKTIAASGASNVSNSTISFTFRGKKYSATRDDGQFSLMRTQDSIDDILKNDGFTRLIQNKPVILSDSIARIYANSVNSVHYFSVLPFGLNDTAVHKKLLPSSKIKGEEYYKIEITFSEQGGGEDFEDVFIYWINKKDFLIEYIAYAYKTNGGGKRFRTVKNDTVIQGIRFINYHNLKPKNKNIRLVDIDKAFVQNELEKVSEIILENIEVAF